MGEQDSKVALITGGAKRVGRAIAEGLVADGFRVVVTYLSSQGDVESLSRGSHGRVHAIRADLTDPTKSVKLIRDEFGKLAHRLDVLVNNASLYEPADLAHTSVELSRRLMAIHFEAPLLLAQTFAPMLRQSRGHIINMCDLLAERPWPQYLAYCASKAALVNLTLGLARELAPEVTVNGIAPGVVEWPKDYPQAEKDKYLQRVPLDRPGSPQDVANLVRFLVTGGSYLTGQIIRLDGGRSIT